MPAWKQYFTVNSVREALETLNFVPSPARLIAGGTDLLLELQQGHLPPVETLVDISRIPELNCLEVRGSSLFIGAAVPVGLVTASGLVRQHAQAVSEACGLIGGPQVRNVATLGGNVVHALPAADGMIALLALDASAEVASIEDNTIVMRHAPLLNLFRGPGKSALVEGRELLSGFSIPLSYKSQASAFQRVMRPQGVALPILNMAVWLERHRNTVVDIRISVGPAGPVPMRAWPIEALLKGTELTSAARMETLPRTDKAWREEMHFRTSPQRATAGYRYHVSSILFEQVLSAAWERASGLMVEAQ
jgi:xanthine dehydrogenase FAD-binding subunit